MWSARRAVAASFPVRLEGQMRRSLVPVRDRRLRT